jgi:hypothetical protein
MGRGEKQMAEMATGSYESPEVEVLGEVSDMTQKFGVYFDYGFATQGKGGSPTSGPGGAGVTHS